MIFNTKWYKPWQNPLTSTIFRSDFEPACSLDLNMTERFRYLILNFYDYLQVKEYMEFPSMDLPSGISQV